MPIRPLTLGIVLTITTACSAGSDSPAKAVERYYEATSENDRADLERYWWISDDEAIRNVIIEHRLIMAKYNETLERKAAKALQELESRGMLGGRTPDTSVPSATQIDSAIANAYKPSAADRLSVNIPGRRSISVAKHEGKWYVEHSHVSAGRAWEPKDLDFYREINALYAKSTQELKEGGIGTAGQLGLRLFLGHVRSEQSKIMRKYDVPMLVM